MNRKPCRLMVFLLGLIVIPAIAQQAPSPTAACGDVRVEFKVKESKAAEPVQPEPGRALVFVIQTDFPDGRFARLKTRIGIDGKWAGATHGDSHFFMGVGPGVHHLCAYTEFSAIGGAQLAFAHFSAQAGAVYYFEVTNKGIGNDLGDVALFPADEDQGRYLVGSTPLIASQPKK